MMKKTGKSLKRRLKNNSGESITEVLVALLVSTLGIVLLAGMINSSTIMINNSKEKIASFVSAGVTVVEQISDAANPNPSGTVLTTVKESGKEDTMKLFDGDNGSTKVEYFENTEAGNITVKSYKVKQ